MEEPAVLVEGVAVGHAGEYIAGMTERYALDEHPPLQHRRAKKKLTF